MDYSFNLEIMEQCRICLQKGDINIWNCKIAKPDTVQNVESVEDSMDKNFFEMLDIFTNSRELLVLSNEFPFLCRQCLEDLKFCCFMYEKIKLANVQLKNLYEDSLNQCIDEEHLIEVIDDKLEINHAEEKEFAPTKYAIHESHDLQSIGGKKSSNTLHINQTKHMPLNSKDALVVTQFISSTLQPSVQNVHQQTKNDDKDNHQPHQYLLTMNLKAVEVKDLKNLETSETLNANNFEPGIYICQYCPQAFAKSDYLKTHIQKSHVCKFCTQAFTITGDLFKHLREVHTEHKCAICHKLLSSHTNLRHHIRRVHRINLPAKVTLIDFIKSVNIGENPNPNDAEQGDTTSNDIEISNIKYISENNENMEMLSENVTE